MTTTRQRLLSWSVALLWCVSGLQLINMVRHPFLTTVWQGQTLHRHWDFRVYSAAYDTVRDGGDPLDMEQMLRRGVDIPYNYSPAFTRVALGALPSDPRTREAAFIGLKFAAIVAGYLVLVFGLDLRGAWRAIAAFLVTFGFGSSLMLDVAAGNITGFEFLWVSVLAVSALRRQNLLFFGAMALLCLGKPIWGIFAIVPVLLHWDRRSIYTFGIGALAFASTLVASFLVSVEGTRRYLGIAFAFRETGYLNPCLREFLASVAATLHLPSAIATALWGLMALAVIGVAALLRARVAPERALAFGASLMLLLPLVLPRFKPYAFILLVPFALLALSRQTMEVRRLQWAVVVLAMPFLLTTDTHLIQVLTQTSAAARYAGYFPLLTATAAWWILARPALGRITR